MIIFDQQNFMSYYCRFLVTDSKEYNMDDLKEELLEVDKKYELVKEGKDQYVLKHKGEAYAEIEVNFKKQDVFKDDIKTLKEELEDTKKSKVKEKILKCLDKTQMIFVVRYLFGGRSEKKTYDIIDPIWGFWYDNYEGMVQADEDGYYENGEEIFEF